MWEWDGGRRRQPACRGDILLCQGLVQPYSVSFEGEWGVLGLLQKVLPEKAADSNLHRAEALILLC